MTQSKAPDKKLWRIHAMVREDRLPEQLESIESEGYEIFQLLQTGSYFTILSRLPKLPKVEVEPQPKKTPKGSS